MRENTDLVQIRPAFGGNIMAQIVTTHTRPQFATVRYKVMNPPPRRPDKSGTVLTRSLPRSVMDCKARLVSVTPVPPRKSISDAEILVVGGRGLKKEADLDMVRELDTCLPVEVDRAKEFAPIKNKTGVDSVESARELCRQNGIEL